MIRFRDPSCPLLRRSETPDCGGLPGGGPHYLARFATERTLTVNTTAAGGNASLLTLWA
jgi:delta 1-pyrroline-5-carboxylate dehydrogenase